MAKAHVIHRCKECGATALRWSGRCATCGAWNAVEEEAVPLRSVAAGPAGAGPVTLASVDTGESAPAPTGVSELDRVLGGGLVPGSVTLVAGEPGIGKSTLLLQVIAATAARGATALLVSAEESSAQVKMRADRLGAMGDRVWILPETTLPAITAAARELMPEIVVVDSIQTVVDPEIGSSPGSVAQVRDCAAALIELAKSTGVAVVLVGHVTKEGALAGPRVLEHAVDTVLSFEGDRHHALRMLRAVKHRFGAVGELGVFEMTDAGLLAVPDAGALFLADRTAGAPGSVVTAAMDGRRPLPVEVQALVVPSHTAMPRRSAHGLDANRLAQLLAVVEKHGDTGQSWQKADVYAAAVGGIRVAEPAADLAVALAVVGATLGKGIHPDVVVFGEVGLSGDVRQVSHGEARLREAVRLGFSRAIVPAGTPSGPDGMRVARVNTLAEAIGLATRPGPKRRPEPVAG